MSLTAQAAPPANAKRDTEAVWAELHLRLRAWIAARVGDSDADDVLQEVFLRVHRSLSGVREPGGLTGWVYRIAQNAVVDHYRKQQRDTAAKARLVHEPIPQPAEPEGHASLERCIQPLLYVLPPASAEALRLTDLGPLTQAQAAEQLGIKLSTLKSRVQRGRKHLATALATYCGAELNTGGCPATDCCS